MLVHRLIGGWTPGDTGIFSSASGNYTSTYFTISTLASATAFGTLYGKNASNQLGTQTGSGNDHRSCYVASGTINYVNFLTFVSAAMCSSISGASGSYSFAASNGSNDLGCIGNIGGTNQATEYFNISGSSNSITGSALYAPGNGASTSNGINDRAVLLTGTSWSYGRYGCVWTMSTRGTATTGSFLPTISFIYGGNEIASNDINDKALFVNGCCGEECGTNATTYGTISTCADAGTFGSNTYGSIYCATASNGINGRVCTHGGYFGGNATISYFNLNVPGNAANSSASIAQEFTAVGSSNSAL